MTTKDGIDTTNTGSHLQIDVHAVVRDHNNDIGLLSLTNLIYDVLHIAVTNTKGPVRNKSRWVGNRCIGEGLANHSNTHITHLLDGVRLEGAQ